MNCSTLQTLPTMNKEHFFMNILSIECLGPQNSHNGTLFFDGALLKHVRHFDYWNQSLNLPMRTCYLDSFEAGLRCYLIIHTENQLHPLQLFYFNLWPIIDSLSYIQVYKVVSSHKEKCSGNLNCVFRNFRPKIHFSMPNDGADEYVNIIKSEEQINLASKSEWSLWKYFTDRRIGKGENLQ
jgi:hypothetical protein